MADQSDEARFEELLRRVERLRRLDVDQLRDLARLYRSHLARLARERERGDDPANVRRLNALCVRAHTILHVAPPSRGGALHAWRAALAGTFPFVVAAAVLLVGGLVTGAALGLRDGAAVHAVVPSTCGYDSGTVDALLSDATAREAFLARTEVAPAMNLIFGASLFAHNTRVGLLAFATGLLAGVPTVVLGLYNGLLLGAFSSIFLRDGLPLAYLAWILPHGVPELTAIVLCGAGGLVFGAAVAMPGRAGRRTAVRAATPRAFALLLLAVPLFAAAAVLESFVRESTLPTGVRFAVVVMDVVVVGLLLRWTRAAPPPDHPPAFDVGALQIGSARSSM